jgi:hypothetical protein
MKVLPSRGGLLWLRLHSFLSDLHDLVAPLICNGVQFPFGREAIRLHRLPRYCPAEFSAVPETPRSRLHFFAGSPRREPREVYLRSIGSREIQPRFREFEIPLLGAAELL